MASGIGLREVGGHGPGAALGSGCQCIRAWRGLLELVTDQKVFTEYLL